jgi:hypothetical protein
MIPGQAGKDGDLMATLPESLPQFIIKMGGGPYLRRKESGDQQDFHWADFSIVILRGLILVAVKRHWHVGANLVFALEMLGEYKVRLYEEKYL